MKKTPLFLNDKKMETNRGGKHGNQKKKKTRRREKSGRQTRES